MWIVRGQKSVILSRFSSINFEGQGVLPCPSILRLKELQAHFCSFINKVCISALRQQLIAVRKQGIKNIPSFFCRQIKVVFLLSHTKITSALTVSVTAAHRAFILCTHSI